MSSRYLAFVLVFVLMLGISLTGYSSARPAHAAPQLTAVRVGIVPVADLIGFYTAIDLGYFKHEGIDVKVTPMAGGAVMLPALQGGSLDLGFSNVLSLIVAASHGLHLVAVTRGDYEVRAHPAHAILLGKDSPIHSAKDFVGKTIAVNTLNSPDHLAMQQWLKNRGVNPASVRFTEVDFPNMIAPLMHGQFDAALASEPFVTVGRSLGAQVVGYDFADLMPRTLLASFIARRSWAAAHTGLIQRFATAFNRGVAFANKNPIQARSYIVAHTPIPAALINQIALTMFHKMSSKDLQYWVRLGLRWHALDRKVDVKRLMWSTAQ